MKPAPLYFINAIAVPIAITFSGVVSPRYLQISQLGMVFGAWLLINLIIVATSIKTNFRAIALAAFFGMWLGVVVLAIVYQAPPIKIKLPSI